MPPVDLRLRGQVTTSMACRPEGLWCRPRADACVDPSILQQYVELTNNNAPECQYLDASNSWHDGHYYTNLESVDECAYLCSLSICSYFTYYDLPQPNSQCWLTEQGGSCSALPSGSAYSYQMSYHNIPPPPSPPPPSPNPPPPSPPPPSPTPSSPLFVQYGT